MVPLNSPASDRLIRQLGLGDCVVIVIGAYQTSRPEIFTVGDVRSGSVKRVASAVGEGSVVVAEIHAYLKGSPGTP